MRRLLAPAMAGVLLSVLVPGLALAASPTLVVYVGEDCVGFDGAANKVHTLWLLEGTEVLSSGKATSDADGTGYVCFDYTVASGHRVKIQPAGVASRTITVPNVSIRTDRAGDIISGNAPAGATVHLFVDVYKIGTYSVSKTIERDLAASAAGAWTTDLTTAGGIRGGDEVWAGIDTAAGDSIWAYMWVEQMWVYRGAPYGLGHVNRGETVTLTLRSSTDVLKGTSTLTQVYADGYAKAAFWSAKDQLVYVRAGDKVTGSFASDAALTVPAMTVKGAASSDQVTVTCPGMAGQGVWLYAAAAGGSKSVERSGVLGSTGSKGWDLTTAIDLKAGDYLEASCKTDRGDEVGRVVRVGP